MKPRELIRLYWFAMAATIVIWSTIGWTLGMSALLTVIVLTLLETTFSADNAVVNSKILTTLSTTWRRVFMTIGILIAVFVVRFILPIVIVMIGASLGFREVLNLALHNPTVYAHDLVKAQPLISAFGGTFLIMIALSYFIDYQKETHWLSVPERYLRKLGKINHVATLIMLVATACLYFTVSTNDRSTMLIAVLAAMALHNGLNLLDRIAGNEEKQLANKKKVGTAAFMTFIYLEILDASFSLDGVIGAFAITSSVILIIAGLGAGAVWVRAMTLHLVRANTLAKYIFIEHGAHWAIGFLGGIMLLRLYDINLPEWLVGSLGLIFIAAAILWSKHYSQNLSTKTHYTP